MSKIAFECPSGTAAQVFLDVVPEASEVQGAMGRPETAAGERLAGPDPHSADDGDHGRFDDDVGERARSPAAGRFGRLSGSGPRGACEAHHSAGRLLRFAGLDSEDGGDLREEHLKQFVRVLGTECLARGLDHGHAGIPRSNPGPPADGLGDRPIALRTPEAAASSIAS